MRQIGIIFVLSTVLMATACSTVPSAGKLSTSRTSGEASKPKGSIGWKVSCDQLTNWVEPLKFLYPNTNLGRLYENAAREKYKVLFEDDHFIKIYGKPFDQLSNRELSKIHRALERSRRDCKSDGFLVSLYPDIFLSQPFNPSLSRGMLFSTEYVVQHVQKSRNSGTSVFADLDKNSNPKSQAKHASHMDLAGTWEGITRCYRQTHYLTLEIAPGQTHNVDGVIDFENAGREMDNIPIRLKHLENHPIPNVFRASNEGSAFAKFRQGNINKASNFWFGIPSAVKEIQEGVAVMELDPKYTCSPFQLVKFEKIPGIERSGSVEDHCLRTLYWMKDGNEIASKIRRIQQRYPASASNLRFPDVYTNTIYGDEATRRTFGVALSSIKESSTKKLIDRVNVCIKYSGREKQITNAIAGNRLYTDVSRVLSANKSGSNAKSAMDGLIKQAKEMEETLDNVPLFQNLLVAYAAELNKRPENDYIEYFESLAERGDSMLRYAALAEKHGLDRLPSGPVGSDKQQEVRPDDEVIPSADDETVEELEKPIVLE